MPALDIDLHSHSTISDGTMQPAALVAHAKARGVSVLALTDHDEVRGLEEAAASADGVGLRFIPGVEISVTWGGQTVHIVGLRIDPDNQGLLHGLEQVRSGRLPRAREMGRQLALAGFPDAYEGALRFVSNPGLISRTHFARHIISTGRCANMKQVFERYLVAGKPGYAEHSWAKLSEAVAWIHGAGGVAVVAHPGRYRLTELALGEMLSEFKQLGGEAIEVVTGSHAPEQFARFATLARHYGFRASRGSDFHGTGESRVDFGELPPLPGDLTPVWQGWF